MNLGLLKALTSAQHPWQQIIASRPSLITNLIIIYLYLNYIYIKIWVCIYRKYCIPYAFFAHLILRGAISLRNACLETNSEVLRVKLPAPP